MCGHLTRGLEINPLPWLEFRCGYELVRFRFAQEDAAATDGLRPFHQHLLTVGATFHGRGGKKP